PFQYADEAWHFAAAVPSTPEASPTDPRVSGIGSMVGGFFGDLLKFAVGNFNAGAIDISNLPLKWLDGWSERLLAKAREQWDRSGQAVAAKQDDALKAAEAYRKKLEDIVSQQPAGPARTEALQRRDELKSALDSAQTVLRELQNQEKKKNERISGTGEYMSW